MKLIFAAISGGLVGAAMVLAVQTGGLNVIDPAQAGSVDSWQRCVKASLMDAHTESSMAFLMEYCRVLNR